MHLESSFIQIPGIGAKTERTLWQSGYTDWLSDVSDAPIHRTARDNIESFASEAAEHLDQSNVHYFDERLPTHASWRLAETFLPSATAIDIETTGLDPTQAVVTTVSFHGPRGTRTLVRDRDLTLRNLHEEFRDIDLLLSFNGARFDLPFLAEHFDIQPTLPHLDLMYPCRRVGLTGGLKAIEQTVGISRDQPDIDGRQAISLWHQAEQGDETALESLISYNQEDTRTLLPLLETVIERLNEQEYYPYIKERTE